MTVDSVAPPVCPGLNTHVSCMFIQPLLHILLHFSAWSAVPSTPPVAELPNNIKVTPTFHEADSAFAFFSFHHLGAFLGFFLKYWNSLCSFTSQSCTSCWIALTCSSTMQIPFALLAFICPVCTDFTAVPALVVECNVIFHTLYSHFRWVSGSQTCLCTAYPMWSCLTSVHPISVTCMQHPGS